MIDYPVRCFHNWPEYNHLDQDAIVRGKNLFIQRDIKQIKLIAKQEMASSSSIEALEFLNIS